MINASSMQYPWADAWAESLASAWRRIAGAIDAIAAARARARAVQHLERLSDRALYDIGLHRGQIRAAVYGEQS